MKLLALLQEGGFPQSDMFLFSTQTQDPSPLKAPQTQQGLTDLHSPAPDVQGADAEVHPDGVLLVIGEHPRLEVLHHAGLAHVRVTDQDDLEQEVEGVVMFRSRGLHGRNGKKRGAKWKEPS